MMQTRKERKEKEERKIGEKERRRGKRKVKKCIEVPFQN